MNAKQSSPEPPRRFGPMRFSSILVIVAMMASGIWFVRSYLLFQRKLDGQNPFAIGSELTRITNLTQAALTGVILVVGPALLLETARRRNSEWSWGIGRMTIAVCGLYLCLRCLFVVIGIVAAEYRRGSTSPSWAWHFLENPNNWGDGLLTDLPLALGAVWIAWRFRGRAEVDELDLQEVVGRCVAVVIFALFLAHTLIE